jgi:hypothetical protein
VGWETERETVQRETRTQRQRRADWSTDVVVPFGQSVLIAGAVVVGALVLVLAVTIWQGWRFWIPFAAAGAVGGVAFAVAAVLLVLDHRWLIWAAERLLSVDLDADGVKGEPEPEPEPVRVELVSEDGRHRRYGRRV